MKAEKVRLVPVQQEEQRRRAAALADEIWHECFAEILVPEQIDYMVEKFQSYPAISRQIAQEGYRYFLAEVAGAEAGYMALVERDGKLMLSKLYLLASWRGRGIAAQMLAAAEEQAKKAGLPALFLTVNRHNARAVAAYRKAGFSLVREQVADIGGGYVMDDYVFEKQLSEA